MSEIYGGPGVDDLTGSTDATDDIYGGSGDDFIDAVDGREDFVDCGRLESLTAGGFDTDTALIDEIDVTVECENTVVSSPNPSNKNATEPGSFGAPVFVRGAGVRVRTYRLARASAVAVW